MTVDESTSVDHSLVKNRIYIHGPTFKFFLNKSDAQTYIQEIVNYVSIAANSIR